TAAQECHDYVIATQAGQKVPYPPALKARLQKVGIEAYGDGQIDKTTVAGFAAQGIFNAGLRRIAADTQRAALWYARINAQARISDVPPHLVLYLDSDIPPELAAVFYEGQVPPGNAGEIYTLITQPYENVLSPHPEPGAAENAPTTPAVPHPVPAPPIGAVGAIKSRMGRRVMQEQQRSKWAAGLPKPAPGLPPMQQRINKKKRRG